MSIEVAALVERHLAAWNARTQAERASVFPSIYTGDVAIGEPHALLAGHAGLEKAIGALQAAMPGMALALDGELQTTQDMTTYRWTMGPPQGRAVVGGRDVVTVAEGRITSVYVFIDAVDAPKDDADRA